MRSIEHFIAGNAVTRTPGRFAYLFDHNSGQVQAQVQLTSAAETEAAVATVLPILR